MDWNWAIKQLFDGKKVTSKTIMDSESYLYMNEHGEVCHGYSNQVALMHMNMFHAKDWELYQEPKKWTEEDIRKAKAGIELGFEWVARDKGGGYVCMFEEKPSKDIHWNSWTYPNPNKQDFVCDKELYKNVKWEDEEPTRLQDIVDSEKENYNE